MTSYSHNFSSWQFLLQSVNEACRPSIEESDIYVSCLSENILP
jgi:hypothetical protein